MLSHISDSYGFKNFDVFAGWKILMFSQFQCDGLLKIYIYFNSLLFIFYFISTLGKWNCPEERNPQFKPWTWSLAEHSEQIKDSCSWECPPRGRHQLHSSNLPIHVKNQWDQLYWAVWFKKTQQRNERHLYRWAGWW